MKQFLILILVVASQALPQSPAKPPESPQDVVGEFMALEARGDRLTVDGWYKANVYFFRPIPSPQRPEVFVMSRDFSVWNDPKIKGETATVMAGYIPEGRIDPDMRLVTTPDMKALKAGLVWNLVLTDTYWKLGADGHLMHVKGPAQWKLAEAGPRVLISRDTAIRYVAEMRNKTSNAAIKKNAAATLATLKKYRE